jgi:hypothetical protein
MWGKSWSGAGLIWIGRSINRELRTGTCPQLSLDVLRSCGTTLSAVLIGPVAKYPSSAFDSSTVKKATASGWIVEHTTQLEALLHVLSKNTEMKYSLN